MTSLDHLMGLKRCPNDGTMLIGMNLWCRSCRSTWAPLFTGQGTSDAEPFDNRDYIRRKIREIETHKLSVAMGPPRAMSRQGGVQLARRIA